MGFPTMMWAQQMLWDRLIVDVDGEPVGMVDDLELSDSEDGGAPFLTAILCGPTALGPRIGDRIGTWWLAVARRLRPTDDPQPIRIPFFWVAVLDRRELRLDVSRDQVGTGRLRYWVDEKIIRRIPGSGHESS
jgi:hypothetical protein